MEALEISFFLSLLAHDIFVRIVLMKVVNFYGILDIFMRNKIEYFLTILHAYGYLNKSPINYLISIYVITR